jgi:hypothetical protein
MVNFKINESSQNKKSPMYSKPSMNKLPIDFFKNIIEQENKLEKEYTEENICILAENIKVLFH